MGKRRKSGGSFGALGVAPLLPLVGVLTAGKVAAAAAVSTAGYLYLKRPKPVPLTPPPAEDPCSGDALQRKLAAVAVKAAQAGAAGSAAPGIGTVAGAGVGAGIGFVSDPSLIGCAGAAISRAAQQLCAKADQIKNAMASRGVPIPGTYDQLSCDQKLALIAGLSAVFGPYMLLAGVLAAPFVAQGVQGMTQALQQATKGLQNAWGNAAAAVNQFGLDVSNAASSIATITAGGGQLHVKVGGTQLFGIGGNVNGIGNVDDFGELDALNYAIAPVAPLSSARNPYTPRLDRPVAATLSAEALDGFGGEQVLATPMRALGGSLVTPFSLTRRGGYAVGGFDVSEALSGSGFGDACDPSVQAACDACADVTNTADPNCVTCVDADCTPSSGSAPAGGIVALIGQAGRAAAAGTVASPGSAGAASAAAMASNPSGQLPVSQALTAGAPATSSGPSLLQSLLNIGAGVAAANAPKRAGGPIVAKPHSNWLLPATIAGVGIVAVALVLKSSRGGKRARS